MGGGGRGGGGEEGGDGGRRGGGHLSPRFPSHSICRNGVNLARAEAPLRKSSMTKRKASIDDGDGPVGVFRRRME